jgi:hypothetical protein
VPRRDACERTVLMRRGRDIRAILDIDRDGSGFAADACGLTVERGLVLVPPRPRLIGVLWLDRAPFELAPERVSDNISSAACSCTYRISAVARRARREARGGGERCGFVLAMHP